MKIKSLNRPAMGTVQQLMDDPGLYGLEIDTLDNGSTSIDAGVRARGGYEAGRLIGKICMGGLGEVEIGVSNASSIETPATIVRTDHPVEACILSQLAGWSIKKGKFRAMGSGPARALAKTEKLFKEFPFEDPHREAVIILESSKFPTEEASGFIADRCDVNPKDLYMITTPTSSLSGTVQVCARVVETGMHKMHTMGDDLEQVIAGSGSCPVPPISNDDLVMMGRTNDAMLYGGNARYIFKDGTSVAPRINEVPSSSSPDYGKPFEQLFKEAGFDFYKLDPGLFSPAVVAVNDRSSGVTFTAGAHNRHVLDKSFGLG